MKFIYKLIIQLQMFNIIFCVLVFSLAILLSFLKKLRHNLDIC